MDMAISIRVGDLMLSTTVPIPTDSEEDLAQAMRQPNMLALCMSEVARTAAFTLEMRARIALSAIRDGVVRKQVLKPDGTLEESVVELVP